MLTIEDLKNTSVAILGFGLEGRSVANYLLKHGIIPVVFEHTPLTELQPESQEIIAEHGLTLHTDEDLALLKDFSIVFRSPGVQDSVFRSYLAPDATVTTQTKFFVEQCKNVIVGVTGTKGKGTTSSVLAAMLQLGDTETRETYLTGNIGKIQPLEFMDALKPEDIIVYELSSFQLQDLGTSPHIGICLMTTADHLDYHSDITEYHEAKAAIAQFQTESDHSIYNKDYPASKAIGQRGNGTEWEISSLEQPARGVFIEGESLRIQGDGEGIESTHIDISNRKLRGLHNRENIAAAVMAGMILKVPAAHIIKAIGEFGGLPHRLQPVAEKNGVSYYDDSISTTPDTAIAALSAFTQPIILLLGGYDKGLDYSELISALLVAPHLKAVVTMGVTGASITQALQAQSFTKPLHGPFTDLSTAVDAARTEAVSGDIILLSPGSASFGMFKNYQERGDQFTALANQ